MTRRGKDKNELEHLRGEVRSLEAEVRRLKKQLRQEQKESVRHDIDILDELLQQEIEESPRLKSCPECHTGHLVLSDLGIKTLQKCNQCSYRKTRSK